MEILEIFQSSRPVLKVKLEPVIFRTRSRFVHLSIRPMNGRGKVGVRQWQTKSPGVSTIEWWMYCTLFNDAVWAVAAIYRQMIREDGLLWTWKALERNRFRPISRRHLDNRTVRSRKTTKRLEILGVLAETQIKVLPAKEAGVKVTTWLNLILIH
jgi:hypothetical protein